MDTDPPGDRGAAAAAASPGMTPALTFLFAVAGGAAVGNLYWSQPLLELIGHDLHAAPGATGWLVTTTQLGYALGILLVVPLGDLVNRRRLVPLMLLCSAAALTSCALAPTFPALLAALGLLGLTTVSGQVLVPLAGDLADPTSRGRVVGTVVSGILIGILVSRTISGVVAGAAGWRAIYLAAALVAVVLAAVLGRAIPTLPGKTSLGYPALLASVGRVVASDRTVRWSLLLGALQFGTFTMFWTALTFLLSAPPFSYPVDAIGLFGLVGLAGALAAQRAGALHDRGWSTGVTGVGWLLTLVAVAAAGFAKSSVVLLVAAILLLDVAIQALNILNQTRLFAVSHEARSRLNTAAVTTNFVAGAAGSAAAGLLWSVGDWTAVIVAELLLSLAGLGVWAAGRRGPLLPPAADHHEDTQWPRKRHRPSDWAPRS